MADDQQQTGSSTEAVSQLQNIARNLSLWAQSIVNSAPVPTTTVSPRFTAVTLGSTGTVVIATSTLRHGLILHNPGSTTCYIYQTGMTSAPTTSNLAGSLSIFAGDTWALPSTMFTNINAGFSGFSVTGSSPFTAIEFF